MSTLGFNQTTAQITARHNPPTGFKPRLSSYLSCLISLFFTLFILLQVASAAPLTFNFTLPSGYTTSGGAYKPDGTLVKTLWRKVYYSGGTHSYTWDGTDDSGAAVPAGNYGFKVIAHNMQYAWDGAIGNSSLAQSGPGVHRSFYPMHDMAISGEHAFYLSGYNEGGYNINHFLTSNPQVVTYRRRWTWNATYNKAEINSANTADREWDFTATDGTWAYYACTRGTDPTTRASTYKGFVSAVDASNGNLASFSSGGLIPEGPSNFPPLANGIYAGTQSGLSGLAVQKTGNLLATAVAPDNKVYFFDKRSGAAIGDLSVTAPGRIEFAPNGDLWVTTGTNVVRYTLTASPSIWTVATTITGFNKPLDVAVHPTNNNIVMVADGGTSQQIKAYNSTGTSLWTYGTAGGYAVNGVNVANNKFWFSNGAKEDTFIAIADDGSFWVGDGGNRRNLHFSASRAYIDQIAWTPHTYSSSVDANNPSRVFSEFLEFNVDYNSPLTGTTGWTLVKNWGAALSAGYFMNVPQGLKQITTFPNGRTYGTAREDISHNQMLVELTGNFLRIITPLDPPSGQLTTILPNGDLTQLAPSVSSWKKRVLTGYDGSNNPQWAAATQIGSATNAPTDPAPRCCGGGHIAAPITSSDVIVSYDKTLSPGFHLGGVKVGGTDWLWKAMPAVTSNIPLDGLGSFDIGDNITYAGNVALAVDRNIVAGYHGEFWNQTQAGQFMHFYDNGLFVGQFGVPGIGHWNAPDGVVAGFAGNGFSPSLVKTSNGELYLWTNDESEHGPQRWHLLGANNIREFSGSGTLGGSDVNLTVPAAAFPTNLVATGATGQVGLSWTGVSGATSYKVKYSSSDGGPYTTISGITGTSHAVGGLTNGTKYYFVVSAVTGGGESSNSDQAEAIPFDTSVVVQNAGEQSVRDKTYDIKTTELAAGRAALTGLNKLAGNLSITDIGSKGYYLYNWGGVGVNSGNILSPFTMTKGTGWKDDKWMEQNFRVDGIPSTTYGLYSNPSGYIDINVSDTNFHYLTVFCSSMFADPRSFNIKLTPQGQSSPVASYSVTENPGKSHTYQFRFKGNVRLTVDSTGGAIGTLRGIFLDDLPVYSPPQSSVLGIGHYVAPQKDTQVVYNVDATAPANGQPALTGLTGLTLNSVGTKGYKVFNWGGNGTHNSNVQSPFTIGAHTGFFSESWIQNRFTIGGTAGSSWALFSNPNGTIPINVSDTATHTLTVFSGAYFADTRNFTIKLIPQGQTTPVASYTVSNETFGKNHIFQFQFTGNVTLKVEAISATNWRDIGVVQAIFLD